MGRLIRNSERQIIEQIQNGQIPDEPAITNQFLGNIQNEINRHGEEHGFPGGLQIQATTVSSMGPNSNESVVGADFSIILDINVENFRLRKGVLFQAKREVRGIITEHPVGRRHSVNFSQGSLTELKPQVENMFNVTPDNFVIIYGIHGFQVVPGNSIQGLTQSDSTYAKPISRFFKEFLMCFIGDPKLNSANVDDWIINEKPAGVKKTLEISIKKK